MWLFSKDPSANFGYDIGALIETLGDWRLHAAKNKKSSEEVSVFVFEIKDQPNSAISQAQGVVKRLKTLRHPNLLTYLDGVETPKQILVATESVTPLSSYLTSKSDAGNFTFMTSWGLYQIARGLAFLNNDCRLIHYNVRMSSVCVTKSGEWKLAGYDFVTASSDSRPNGVSQTDIYWPGDSEKVDSWGLGCLIWEVFNQRLTNKNELRQLKLVPGQLSKVFPLLVHLKVTQRILVEDFIKRCCQEGGFFDNFYVQTLLFLEEIQLRDQKEKLAFFTSLSDRIESFPDDIAKYKILPHLLNCFQFGGSGIEVLVPLLKLTKLLEQSEFEKTVLPCLVKMFSAPDRATRVQLLEFLPSFVNHLPSSVVNDQILPPVCQGFVDTNPVVREATIRAMVPMAPKLSVKSLNDTLPRHLSHLQVKDDQGGIRTNASVCLAKLAGRMTPATRQGPVLNAFLKCTRDPFPPARGAAVAALGSSLTLYSIQDVATKVLPCLAFLAVDQAKEVRDQVFKVMHAAIKRLEQASEDPDSIEEASTDTVDTTGTVTWTNWAVSALSSKFTRASKQPAQDSVKQETSVAADSPKTSTKEHKPPAKTLLGASKKSAPMTLEGKKVKEDPSPAPNDDPFSLNSQPTGRKTSLSSDFVEDTEHQHSSSYDWDAPPATKDDWIDNDDDDWGSIEMPASHTEATNQKATTNDWNVDNFFEDFSSQPAPVKPTNKAASAKQNSDSKVVKKKVVPRKSEDNSWDSWSAPQSRVDKKSAGDNDWGDW